MNLQFENRVVEEVWTPKEIAIARDAGDIEKAAELDKRLRLPNGQFPKALLERIDRYETRNINTIEGKLYALDLIGVVQSNTGLSWYVAPWYSATLTPDYTWDGDFAALANVDEFTLYTGTDPVGGRQKVNFTAAVATGSRADITNPTRAQFTIDGGVVDSPVSGMCVTNNSTKSYAGGSAKLLAAVKYSSDKLYNASEVRYVGYQLYIP